MIISNGDRSFIYFNEGVIDGKYDATLCEAVLVIIIIIQPGAAQYTMTVQPYTGHTHMLHSAPDF